MRTKSIRTLQLLPLEASAPLERWQTQFPCLASEWLDSCKIRGMCVLLYCVNSAIPPCRTLGGFVGAASDRHCVGPAFCSACHGGHPE